MTNQRELQAILRRDLGSFVRKTFLTVSPGQTFLQTWSIDAIVHALERVRSGACRRLIINVPPRSLKSTAASVAFPAFLLGHDPTRRIICVSYAAELSRNLSNQFRAVVTAPWYVDLFPGTRVGRFKDSETEVEFTRRGYRLATSVGGTLTGRGGDLIIIDDPLKPADAHSESKRAAANQWFNNTLLSRLDDKSTGAIIIVMQRVHMDDLTGFVLQQGEPWEVLRLPAIAEVEEIIPLSFGRSHLRRIGDVLSPEREPRSILEGLRQQLGSDLFSAQYQQAPVPPGGAMIKRHWVQRYTDPPTDVWGSMIVQSWDTASKGGPENDWSVCTTWLKADTAFYLIDVWRDRVDYPTLKQKVVELARQHRADQVLIEEAGTAIGLLQELGFEVSNLTPVKPDKDKKTRMAIASAKFEAGQVFLPERATWLPDLETELFSFPGSRHDDQIDSISQALNHKGDDWMRMWALLSQ